MGLMHRIAGVALAAAAVAAIVWASHLPMSAHASPDAILRVAWSARPERIEECRTPTADELAQLPKHMRQRQICEGTVARYRLAIRVNDVLVADQEVRGGGLRHDRRLYVFREVPVPPGEAAVDVRFTRIDSPTATSASHQRGEVVPPRLELEERVHFRPREVVLVTYEADERELEVERD